MIDRGQKENAIHFSYRTRFCSLARGIVKMFQSHYCTASICMLEDVLCYFLFLSLTFETFESAMQWRTQNADGSIFNVRGVLIPLVSRPLPTGLHVKLVLRVGIKIDSLNGLLCIKYINDTLFFGIHPRSFKTSLNTIWCRQLCFKPCCFLLIYSTD